MPPALPGKAHILLPLSPVTGRTLNPEEAKVRGQVAESGAEPSPPASRPPLSARAPAWAGCVHSSGAAGVLLRVCRPGVCTSVRAGLSTVRCGKCGAQRRDPNPDLPGSRLCGFPGALGTVWPMSSASSKIAHELSPSLCTRSGIHV